MAELPNWGKYTSRWVFPGPRLCLPSVLLTAVPSPLSYPAPGLLMDIPHPSKLVSNFIYKVSFALYPWLRLRPNLFIFNHTQICVLHWLEFLGVSGILLLLLLYSNDTNRPGSWPRFINMIIMYHLGAITRPVLFPFGAIIYLFRAIMYCITTLEFQGSGQSYSYSFSPLASLAS